jgi:signal transduction histidine kinase
MNIGKKVLGLLRMRITGLLLVAIIASSILILTNYASLKITSAVRAYINGESQYSKGQKDATRNLIMYLNTSELQYWNDFQRELDVPIGDSIARITMMNNGDEAITRNGFLQGRNKVEDLDELIWLFQNFKNVSFMHEAIVIWKNADHIVGQVGVLGSEVHQKMLSSTLSETEKAALIRKINLLTAELTKLERAFSDSLGSSARRIDIYLFYFNLIMTLLIIAFMIIYIVNMVDELRLKNLDLIATNQELDKFVYSASHDLRAPISSMKGLIGLISKESNFTEIEAYLKLMTTTLNKQDQFIREIIDFSRNKKAQIIDKAVSLTKIIDETILQHQYMPNASAIVIHKDINLDVIQSDNLRLEIIFKNILSNAIKFADLSKDNSFISIKTFKEGHQAIIKIEDNGIGIDQNYLDQIFEMFFVTDHAFNGSGLGLYITKEAVSKLNGTIKVESEKGKGSKFTIRLPQR